MVRLLPHLMILLAFCVIPGDALATGAMRCGQWVISSGDSIVTVISRCGEPLYKEVISGGEGSRGQRVEQWTYSQGPNRFIKILEFRSGILVSIRSGKRL